MTTELRMKSESDMTTAELVESLDYAKDAVRACLESAGTLVDMHGLAYWAEVVERRRSKVAKRL